MIKSLDGENCSQNCDWNDNYIKKWPVKCRILKKLCKDIGK